MTATGVRTNGVGKITRQHLNLSRTLADTPEFRPIKDRVFVSNLMPRKAPAKVATAREVRPPRRETILYRLRLGAQYLRSDKAGTTTSVGWAWKGQAEACLQVCAEVPLAAPMMMERV